jgi:hypothetical protein
MKDTTPEEEEDMKRLNWDLEDVKLGPVRERFIQPSLINLPAEHEKTINDARTVMERVESFTGDAVCPCSTSMHGDELHMALFRSSISTVAVAITLRQHQNPCHILLYVIARNHTVSVVAAIPW